MNLDGLHWLLFTIIVGLIFVLWVLDRFKGPWVLENPPEVKIETCLKCHYRWCEGRFASCPVCNPAQLLTPEQEAVRLKKEQYEKMPGYETGTACRECGKPMFRHLQSVFGIQEQNGYSYFCRSCYHEEIIPFGDKK